MILENVILLQIGLYCLQSKPRNLGVYVYTFTEWIKVIAL
jgi:hypothetical protein